jgi:hypothetical protein
MKHNHTRAFTLATHAFCSLNTHRFSLVFAPTLHKSRPAQSARARLVKGGVAKRLKTAVPLAELADQLAVASAEKDKIIAGLKEQV